MILLVYHVASTSTTSSHNKAESDISGYCFPLLQPIIDRDCLKSLQPGYLAHSTYTGVLYPAGAPAKQLTGCMLTHTDIDTVVIALESTSVYSIHIANFLS